MCSAKSRASTARHGVGDSNKDQASAPLSNCHQRTTFTVKASFAESASLKGSNNLWKNLHPRDMRGESGSHKTVAARESDFIRGDDKPKHPKQNDNWGNCEAAQVNQWSQDTENGKIQFFNILYIYTKGIVSQKGQANFTNWIRWEKNGPRKWLTKMWLHSDIRRRKIIEKSIQVLKAKPTVARNWIGPNKRQISARGSSRFFRNRVRPSGRPLMPSRSSST